MVMMIIVVSGICWLQRTGTREEGDVLVAMCSGGAVAECCDANS